MRGNIGSCSVPRSPLQLPVRCLIMCQLDRMFNVSRAQSAYFIGRSYARCIHVQLMFTKPSTADQSYTQRKRLGVYAHVILAGRH